MPYTLKALMGDKGIDLFFVLLFMALTSTVSSSMIAVSSILSFDVYKTYMNPRASDKRLVKVSHLTVITHGIFITGIALALNYGGANMTWIGYFRPILSCPGIIPLALTLLWSRQTRLAAIISPILGFFTGLAIWLGTAYSLYGRVDLVTTGNGLPALYGATASFFSPGLYSVLISLYHPYEFDWRIFLRIELADEKQLTESSDQANDKTIQSKEPDVHDSEPSDTEGTHIQPRGSTPDLLGEKHVQTSSVPTSSPETTSLDAIQHPFDAQTLRKLHWWHRVAWIWFVFIVLVTFVLWPMPLYRDYIFTKSFFSGWVTVAIFWQFLAFFSVVIYPLYDGWSEIKKGVRGVWQASTSLLQRKE